MPRKELKMTKISEKNFSPHPLSEGSTDENARRPTRKEISRRIPAFYDEGSTATEKRKPAGFIKYFSKYSEGHTFAKYLRFTIIYDRPNEKGLMLFKLEQWVPEVDEIYMAQRVIDRRYLDVMNIGRLAFFRLHKNAMKWSLAHQMLAQLR